MAKIIITILFLCLLYVCIAERVIESDAGKTQLKVYTDIDVSNCGSVDNYHRACSTAWDGQKEVENGISFRHCCEAAIGVKKSCIRNNVDRSIYYIQQTCNYASISCLGAPGPSPLNTPSFPPSPTPEQPSPIPQPPPVSPSPTPEQPSPIPQPPSVSPSPTPEQTSPIPQPPSVSPSPTPEQPSPIPQPPSVSPSPTPEQSSPIPQPPSVSPSPTPEQPSPIPQPPSVSPSPTPEQSSPIPQPPSVSTSPTPTPEQPSPIPQPPSVSPSPTPEQPSPIPQPPSVSPSPTPEQPSPIPQPPSLSPPTPQPSPDQSPPPNHPIRPKNCLVATVLYDSCDPKAPDVSHSSATPYEKQFIPSESGIAKINAADCCVALSIIDNKCDSLIRDMSYIKLREFFRLEQACGLP